MRESVDGSSSTTRAVYLNAPVGGACVNSGRGDGGVRGSWRGGVARSLQTRLHGAPGEGYCTFNGLALAARAAVGAGAERVLILDFDAHGGGGTWSLLSGDRSFVSVDVSTYDFDRPKSSKQWKSVLVTNAASCCEVIERELSALEGQFDLCLYNAGMDPCELSDQGMPGLKQSMLARRERMVFDWCASRAVPVAFVLAGGYLSPRLDRGAWCRCIARPSRRRLFMDCPRRAMRPEPPEGSGEEMAEKQFLDWWNVVRSWRSGVDHSDEAPGGAVLREGFRLGWPDIRH
jgi:hypothetical protein